MEDGPIIGNDIQITDECKSNLDGQKKELWLKFQKLTKEYNLDHYILLANMNVPIKIMKPTEQANEELYPAVFECANGREDIIIELILDFIRTQDTEFNSRFFAKYMESLMRTMKASEVLHFANMACHNIEARKMKEIKTQQ